MRERVRSWAAAALLVGVAVWWSLAGRYVSPGQSLVGAALVVGLVIGKPPARAALLGFAAWAALDMALSVRTALAVSDRTSFAIAASIYGGAVVLLAPWRPLELARSDWAVALCAFAASAAWQLFDAGVTGAGVATVLASVAAIGVAQRRHVGLVFAVAASAMFAWVVTAEIARTRPAPHDPRVIAWAALAYFAALAPLGGVAYLWPDARPEVAAPDNRRYWGLVLASALTCLAAMAWRSHGLDLLPFAGLRVVGCCACAAIAVAMATTDLRRTWPAALALAASIPLLDDVSTNLVSYRDWFANLQPADALAALAGVVTTISALIILIRRPAPSTDVPRAQIA